MIKKIAYWLVFALFTVWFLMVLTAVTHGQELSKEETVNVQSVYVKVIYEVETGDTLDSIASRYMKENTYGPRELNEFKSGIVEMNPWVSTKGIAPGDRLDIRYWRKIK